MCAMIPMLRTRSSFLLFWPEEEALGSLVAGGGAEDMSRSVETVSYTHLDVYKRQVQPQSETVWHQADKFHVCLLYTSRCV